MQVSGRSELYYIYSYISTLADQMKNDYKLVLFTKPSDLDIFNSEIFFGTLR